MGYRSAFQKSRSAGKLAELVLCVNGRGLQSSTVSTTFASSFSLRRATPAWGVPATWWLSCLLDLTLAAGCGGGSLWMNLFSHFQFAALGLDVGGCGCMACCVTSLLPGAKRIRLCRRASAVSQPLQQNHASVDSKKFCWQPNFQDQLSFTSILMFIEHRRPRQKAHMYICRIETRRSYCICYETHISDAQQIQVTFFAVPGSLCRKFKKKLDNIPQSKSSGCV